MQTTPPEIRYTKGPEELRLGELALVRADLDINMDAPSESRNGWQPVTQDLAAQALLPARVDEYGFEARNYTPTAAGEVQTSAPSGTSGRRANKNLPAGDGAAQE